MSRGRKFSRSPKNKAINRKALFKDKGSTKMHLNELTVRTIDGTAVPLVFCHLNQDACRSQRVRLASVSKYDW
jgi:hypothetical protein